jgi:hypothetical protein
MIVLYVSIVYSFMENVSQFENLEALLELHLPVLSADKANKP